MVELVTLAAALIGACLLFLMMLIANFLAFGISLFVVSKVVKRRMSGMLQRQASRSQDE